MSRHASPVARASSRENQPRWKCLQDKASGPAPAAGPRTLEVDQEVRRDPAPRIIRPKERNVRPGSNMGYLSGQSPMEGTTRGDRALLQHGGAALWGHVT